MYTITSRQKEVFTFIEQKIEEHRYPPSYREISSHFNWAGPRAAAKHVDALVKKGYLRKGRGARALEIVSHITNIKTLGSNIPSFAIPILGRVAAGYPILAEENLIGHFMVDSSLVRTKQTFLLKIQGESMNGAGIFDGDLVLVKQQADADSGAIVVAMIEGEATVKRLVKKRRKLILQPDNPGFKRIVITEKDTSFQILGKVISLIRPVI